MSVALRSSPPPPSSFRRRSEGSGGRRAAPRWASVGAPRAAGSRCGAHGGAGPRRACARGAPARRCRNRSAGVGGVAWRCWRLRGRSAPIGVEPCEGLAGPWAREVEARSMSGDGGAPRSRAPCRLRAWASVDGGARGSGEERPLRRLDSGDRSVGADADSRWTSAGRQQSKWGPLRIAPRSDARLAAKRQHIIVELFSRLRKCGRHQSTRTRI